MNTEQIEELIRTSDRLVGAVSTDFRRYLEVDWRDRLICLVGARGTGKTTILRQRMKDAFGVGSDQAIYISLDDLFFSQYHVRDVVDYLHAHGFTHLFIDEVHHFGRDWSLLIKNLSDLYPDLNIVYSGSSMLKIESSKGDLSRRQAVYRLKGLSFREFLKFEGVADFPALELERILSEHRRIAARVTSKLKILGLFDKYLKGGFYPFYREAYAQYNERLVETVNKVLEVDYPSIDEVSQETIRTTKKMLKVLASSTPQTPNMSELYRELGTERNQGLKMLGALDRAGLLAVVQGKGAKLGNLSRPEKIFCDNTNLMYALVPQINQGTKRETYFYNQLRKDHEALFTGVGDFVVDGRWTFEVGGKGKTFKQIADIPDSFVVSDDIEIGLGNKIPLWLFGFLY